MDTAAGIASTPKDGLTHKQRSRVHWPNETTSLAESDSWNAQALFAPLAVLATLTSRPAIGPQRAAARMLRRQEVRRGCRRGEKTRTRCG